MICESCQKHEATVHQLDVSWLDGVSQVTPTHFCPPCARDKGVHVPGNIPSFPSVIGMLGKALLGMQPGQDLQEPSEDPCPDCGWEPSEYSRSNRLGCPQDYEAFPDFVAELLAQAQGGASQHPMSAQEAQLEELRAKMSGAVQSEDYEAAASLRDEIRKTENLLETSQELDF